MHINYELNFAVSFGFIWLGSFIVSRV